MSDDEQIRNQESQINRLRAEIAESKLRIVRVIAMHNSAQAHIKTLQGIIDRGNTANAERVFR